MQYLFSLIQLFGPYFRNAFYMFLKMFSTGMSNKFTLLADKVRAERIK